VAEWRLVVEQVVVDRAEQVSSISIMLVTAEQEPMELVVEEVVAVVALKPLLMLTVQAADEAVMVAFY